MDSKFDWYQTTIQESVDFIPAIRAALLAEFDLSDFAPCHGKNGYTHGAKVIRGSQTFATLSWGGQSGINVWSSSDNAPRLHRALEALRCTHLPTRIDSAMDWSEEGLFDVIAQRLIDFAKENRLSIRQDGDWARGQGRSLYIGSLSSPVYLVWYEKGWEQKVDDKNWCRLEARISPKKQHARQLAAQFTPDDVFSCGWLPKALDAIGYFHTLKSKSIGTVWRPSDADRARAAMLKQYGSVIRQWAAESLTLEEFATDLLRAVDQASLPFSARTQQADAPF